MSTYGTNGGWQAATFNKDIAAWTWIALSNITQPFKPLVIAAYFIPFNRKIKSVFYNNNYISCFNSLIQGCMGMPFPETRSYLSPTESFFFLLLRVAIGECRLNVTASGDSIPDLRASCLLSASTASTSRTPAPLPGVQ